MVVNMEGILFGMGNPLLDISAVVNSELLDKYELKANSAIMAEEKHMGIYNDLIEHFDVTYVAGGSAQNTIRGAQWMLPLGSTSYTGCVGKDAFGKLLRETSEKAGLNVAYMEVDNAPTGTCAVCITNHDRSFVANLAACEKFRKAHLETPAVAKLIEEARFFYIEGFFLTHGSDSALYVAEHVAKHADSKYFMMNLSAPFVAKFFKKQVEMVLPYWDVIFGNETEAAAFAESFEFGTENLEEIALKLSQMPKITSRPRMVVITHGSKPTILAYEGKVTTYPVLPISKDKIVDSNGAGDAFCAGFLSEMIRGKGIEDCIKAANYCASVVIQRVGPTFPESSPSF